MTSIRAVVFDIGGVLKLLSGRSRYREWIAAHGIDLAPVRGELEKINRDAAVGAITEEQMNNSVRALLGLSEAEFSEASEAIWADSVGTLNKEMAEYFGRLRPRFRTALLSNGYVGARQREHEKHGFQDSADVVVYSYEVGMLKPDPRIYALTCQRLGVEPAESVFLDDLPDNVLGARAAGMRAILFRDNTQAIVDLESHLWP